MDKHFRSRGTFLAALLFLVVMLPAASAEEVWKSNDFESGEAWFTSGTGKAELTTYEAYSGDHSLMLSADSGLHVFKPFAALPPLKEGQRYGSFKFRLMIFVFENTGTGQSLRQSVRFSKPNNKGESDWVTSRYEKIRPGWNEMSLDITKAANANSAAGRTKLSQASLQAYAEKKGSYAPYKPYYIDDVSFTYTIVPDSKDDQTP